MASPGIVGEENEENEDELESPSAVDLERRPDPPEIDPVDEAGFESFPASDPPAIHIERG